MTDRPPPTPPLRVLVVDDDRDVAETVAGWVAEFGLEARFAHTVADARREIGADRFAVAVVDWRLPDGYGTEVLTALADRSPETFRVVFSAFPDADSEATAAGAHDVVDKGRLGGLRNALRRGERFARGLVRLIPPPPTPPWVGSAAALLPPSAMAGHVLLVPLAGRVPPEFVGWVVGLGADRFPVIRFYPTADRRPVQEVLFGSVSRSERGLLDQPGGVTLVVAGFDGWPPADRAVLVQAAAGQVIRRVGADRAIPTPFRVVATSGIPNPPDDRPGGGLVRVDLPPAAAGPNPGGAAAAAVQAASGGAYRLAPASQALIAQLGMPWNVAELDCAVAALAARPSLTEITVGDLKVPVLEAAAAADPPPSFYDFRRAAEGYYLGQLLRLTAGNMSRAAELAKIARQALYKAVGTHFPTQG